MESSNAKRREYVYTHKRSKAMRIHNMILAGLALMAVSAFGQRAGTSGAPQGHAAPGAPRSGSGGPVRTGPVGPYRGPLRAGAIYVPVPVIPYGAGYIDGYAYPPYYGGYDPGYGYGYDPSAGYAQPPAVVINPNYQPDTVNPVLRDYSNMPSPQPPGVVQLAPQQPANVQALGGTALRDDQPTIFLIAMKDHTIFPVIAYWVDKDSLKYVTVETVVKSVPLDQVDRDMSQQLNDQRHVEFKLPSR